MDQEIIHAEHTPSSLIAGLCEDKMGWVIRNTGSSGDAGGAGLWSLWTLWSENC